jgi:hypothetical protein
MDDGGSQTSAMEAEEEEEEEERKKNEQTNKRTNEEAKTFKQKEGRPSSLKIEKGRKCVCQRRRERERDI